MFLTSLTIYWPIFTKEKSIPSIFQFHITVWCQNLFWGYHLTNKVDWWLIKLVTKPYNNTVSLYKLHTKHMTGVMTSSTVFFFIDAYHWFNYQRHTIYGSWFFRSSSSLYNSFCQKGLKYKLLTLFRIGAGQKSTRTSFFL